jgi:tight adherence protein B
MFIILILALALLIIGGTILSFATVQNWRGRLALEQRVDLARGNSRFDAGSATEEAVAAAAMTTLLRTFFTLGMTDTWGIRFKPFPLLIIGIFVALAAYLLSSLVVGASFWIAIPAAAVCFLLVPRLSLGHQQRQVERKFANHFPDAIDMSVRMLRAGLPIAMAIRTIANDASAPVSGVFQNLADQVEIGIPFDEALSITGKRVNLPDFRFFTVAVALQRTTGGNLAETLEIISDIMRKRRAVRLKAQAMTGEVRMSAYILGAMPFLVVGALWIIQPGYLAPLMTDPRGRWIVGTAAASLITGFITMRQMMRSAIRL